MSDQAVSQVYSSDALRVEVAVKRVEDYLDLRVESASEVEDAP